MPNNKIEHVVIVGGGTAGWMTAASLSNTFQKNIKITLVESSEIGTVGVGEATNATIRRFYGALGMSDIDVLKATQGTCKLGIEFKNWHTEDSTFIHPFGLYGQDVRKVGFHHYWLKLHQLGNTDSLADYSLGVNLAKHNKFTTPSDNPPSMLSIFDWALHFDASMFAKLMREFAEGKGVCRIDAKIQKVNLKPDNGFIDSLNLDNGDTLSGDLFIDCSGFKGLLIEEALNTGYEEWSEWLLCDSAVAVQSELTDKAAPRTISTAQKAGWQWNIPLQHRQGNGYVYSSEFISNDQATNALLGNISGKLTSEPSHFTFTPGRRKQAWNKNCIAVGLAAGFLEPLESTSIALIETAIEKTIMLFPDKSMQQGSIDEFNDMTRLEWERVRDFIVLHYHLSTREDSAFWKKIQNTPIPQTLEHKIKLFKERGHLVKYRWEIFQPASWIALYSGNNVLPKRYDPIVDNYDVDYLTKSFAAMKTSIQDAVAGTTSHSEFLSKYVM